MLVPAKPWWQSKTVWFNIIGGAVMALEAIQEIGLDYGWIATGLAVGNMILRFMTNKPVTMVGEQKVVD